MAYYESQIDRDNTKWFLNDMSIGTLKSISVDGCIRGIKDTSIYMTYPISVLAGKNGSGKSTLLALSACAYHNTESGYKQQGRNKSYYTFGDFFTFSADEEGIKKVSIKYEFAASEGKKEDARRKKPSGKWNDFNTRRHRNVVFLGINRVVPPSESSVHRNYNRKFLNTGISDSDKKMLIDAMSRIFGHGYSNLSILQHAQYRLYKVERNHFRYSGFNMGAGENAVLNLLLEMLYAGSGAFIIIDEIELGLHVDAQRKLIDTLKEMCVKLHCQIICSTHSDEVLDRLPLSGRFFIEPNNDSTNIIPGISSEYAFGKMACCGSDEVDIFVEDSIGEAVIRGFLSGDLRERVNIYPIGSDQAIIRQMAARYRESKLNFIAFFDGDKRAQKNMHIRQIKNALEDRVNDNFDNEMRDRMYYLPGKAWPEKCLVEFVIQKGEFIYFANRWETNESILLTYFEQGLAAGKHNEFFEISSKVHLPKDSIVTDIVGFYKEYNDAEIHDIREAILKILNQ